MDAFDYKQIKKYYRMGSFNTMAPSQFVEDHGDVLFNCIKMLIDPMLHTTTAILAGYYTSDLKTSVQEIHSIFKDKNCNIPIVIYNMLQLEFAFDLFRFASRRSPHQFLAIFAKYAKYFPGTPTKELSDWLHEQTCDAVLPECDEEIDMIKKTVAAMQFVILHECAHSQDDLRNYTTKMFFNHEEYTKLTEGLSNEEQKEVACDYIALYEMVSPQCQICNHIETSLNTSATDSYAAGILMQHADALFRLLKYGFSAGNAGDQNLDSLYCQIVEQLHKRCYPLQIALQITENTSTMPLGDLDIGQAYSYATDLIGDFMRSMGEALQILGKSSTGTIEEQTDYQSVKQDVNEDEIWFRVSLMEKE